VAEQRYSVCVAAERRYVLLDPVKRGDQVQDGVVAGSAAVLSTQETCASQIFTDDEREFYTVTTLLIFIHSPYNGSIILIIRTIT